MLHNLMPKVLRDLVDIQHLEANRRNLQLFVLNTLSVLSCEIEDFFERCFDDSRNP